MIDHPTPGGSKAPVRVLIVDDQLMIRLGLRGMLEASDGTEVVADLEDGLQAVDYVKEHPVDLVLMDIRMPGIDGVEATRRIRADESTADVKILVLTTFDNDSVVIAALRAGANGFLSKGVGPEELIAGIVDVAQGGGVLSARASAALIEQVAQTAAPSVDEALAATFTQLTPRERDIVIAAASGRDNQQIAQQFFVSPFTVKTHVSRAMMKVGARDRAQLVALTYQAGLVR